MKLNKVKINCPRQQKIRVIKFSRSYVTVSVLILEVFNPTSLIYEATRPSQCIIDRNVH